MFDDDRDGFDEWVPEELRPWFDKDKLRFGHYILVNGKIKEASLLEWAQWFENIENRRIDYTEISEGVFVSTVFLGIGGATDLFESMVMGGKYANKGWKYNSYGEAKKGHWQIVDCIRRGEPPLVEFGERPFIELFLEMFKEEEEEEDDENNEDDENKH